MNNKKHPCAVVCIFCGETKGIGVKSAKKGVTPLRVIADYEPCDKCKRKFNEGVPVIEVSYKRTFKNQPPITEDSEGKPVYPTGDFIVINPKVMGGGYKIGEVVLSMDTDYRRIYDEIKRAEGER